MDSKKLMAIDYGSKRVGIASTDETGEFALPRMVLENNAALLDKVLTFAEKERISKIILGESKDFRGIDNPIQSDIEKFRSQLEEHGVEVIYHPEILTTVEARQLQGQTEMTYASAAALILKSYLESRV